MGEAPAGRQGGGRAGGQGRGGGRGAQPRVRKVLLAWADTRNGQAQHAFTSHALAIVERLGYESGLWDTFIRTDSHIICNQALKTDGTPASGGPSLNNVDGIFFLGHREVPITDAQKAELVAFVRAARASSRRTPASRRSSRGRNLARCWARSTADICTPDRGG